MVCVCVSYFVSCVIRIPFVRCLCVCVICASNIPRSIRNWRFGNSKWHAQDFDPFRWCLRRRRCSIRTTTTPQESIKHIQFSAASWYSWKVPHFFWWGFSAPLEKPNTHLQGASRTLWAHEKRQSSCNFSHANPIKKFLLTILFVCSSV